MAVRGVYTEAEKKMLEIFNDDAAMMSGWSKGLSPRCFASAEAIKSVSKSLDCWNPLYNDEAYGADTRWGSIIAPLFYPESFCSIHYIPNAAPEVGFADHIYIGEDWDFFKPVCVDDKFRVWRRPSQMIDITALDGKGARRYKYIPNDVDCVNQNGELVCSMKQFLEYGFLPEPPRDLEAMPEYVYTKEELELVERIINEEEIRGADIRYWEDVNIGDEPKPVALGPTTVWDLISFNAGFMTGFVPMREIRKHAPWTLVLDPETGVTHADIEMHLSERVARIQGNPRMFVFGALARQLMARLVTNWMGDDGFIKRYSWRHLARTAVGDSLIGHGKVIDKRVENGEYLVDIEVWLDNLRGNVTETAVVTVSLLSKEDLFGWK